MSFISKNTIYLLFLFALSHVLRGYVFEVKIVFFIFFLEHVKSLYYRSSPEYLQLSVFLLGEGGDKAVKRDLKLCSVCVKY